MNEDKTPPEGHALFEDAEVEIINGSSLDEKLDKIIDLLKRNEQEHEDIKERLGQIETNQELLRESYQQHGKTLGELMARMNGHFGEDGQRR